MTGTTYYYGFESPGLVDMRDFNDLKGFVSPTATEAYRYTRMFFRSPVRAGGKTYDPTNVCIAGDSEVYWYLNGTWNARYRHFKKMNALRLDLSVRSAKRVSDYGWEVLLE